MAKSTLATYCRTKDLPCSSAPVYFLDMLQSLCGDEYTLNMLELSASQESLSADTGMYIRLRRETRGLCSALVSIGYLEPILRMALLLRRWQDGEKVYASFLQEISELEVCGEKLDEVCKEAVNYYLEARKVDEVSDFGAEFPLLTQYVREKFPQRVDSSDPLVLAGWGTNYLDMPEDRAGEVVRIAQLMTEYLLPALTKLCKEEGYEDARRKRVIAVYLLKQYTEWSAVFAHDEMHLPYTQQEIDAMGRRETAAELQSGEVLSGAQKVFIADSRGRKHLDRFKPFHKGFGQAYCNFLACRETDLFQNLYREAGDAISKLAPAAVYCLYGENCIAEAIRLILDQFSNVNDIVTGFASLQRIAVMCFLENEDALLGMELYRYICQLYDRYCQHANYNRRFPHQVMLLVEKRKDELLTSMMGAMNRAIGRIKEEMGELDEEEVIRAIEEDESVVKLRETARRLPFSMVDLEKTLNDKQERFFKAIGEEPEDLYSRLGNPDAIKAVRDLLMEGEAVMRCLKLLEDIMPEQVDYSPALIEITKVLEFVLNQVFNRVYSTAWQCSISASQRNFYYQYGKLKRDLELASAVYMLYPKDPSREDDLFKLWGLGTVLEIHKLCKLHTLRLKDGLGNEMHFDQGTVNDENTDDANRKMLRDALGTVTTCRNKAAHKGKVERTTYEEAEQKLLSGEYLLWILLYIMKL